MDHGQSSMVQEVGESGWESNPPRPATRPATGFEDQEAHRDLTTPTHKDNRRQKPLQAALSLIHKKKTLQGESRVLGIKGCIPCICLGSLRLLTPQANALSALRQ